MSTLQVKTGWGHWLGVAAVLSWLSLSWPIHIPTLQYVIRERELPIRYVFGQPIRGLGGGFLEAWGMDAIIISILAFGVLSALDILAGYWLWKRQRRGVTLALLLLPAYWFFAIGWMVPYMWMIGAPKAIALASVWRNAR